MKITERKLRKIVKEELVGFRHPPNRLDEGLLDFFAGLFNSVLALFGVEIQKASDETHKSVVTYANQALVDRGINDKFEDLDPDNPDHADALKAIAPGMVEDALKGVHVDLEAMKDVPPLPEPPAGDADDAAKDQYEADEAKMKKGAEGLGKLLGATEALGTHYPEFKDVADQVKKNKPTAPADIFYQAGILAKAFEDAEVFKEHFQRYEGLDKLHEYRFFHRMTLVEALYSGSNRMDEGFWDTIADTLGMGKDEEEVEKIESDVEEAEQAAEDIPLKLRADVRKIANQNSGDTLTLMKAWLKSPTAKYRTADGDETTVTNGQMAAVTLLHVDDAEAEEIADALDVSQMQNLTIHMQTLTELSQDDVDGILGQFLKDVEDAPARAEEAAVKNIPTLASAIETSAVTYLSATPETKEFAALGDPSKLPSTEAEGEMGEAAREAQAQSEGDVEFDVAKIIELGGDDAELLANVVVMMPEEKAIEFLATLDPKIAAAVINTAVVVTTLEPDTIAGVSEKLELALPAVEEVELVKGKELVQAALEKMEVEQVKAIAGSGEVEPDLEEMFTAVVGEEAGETEFDIPNIIRLAADDPELLANVLVMMPEENVVELLAKLEIPVAAQVVNHAIKITSLDPDIIGVVGEELELQLPAVEEAQPVNGKDIVKAAMEKLGPDSEWGNTAGGITKSDEIEDEAKKALGVQTEGRWIGDGKRLSDLLFEGKKSRKRIHRYDGSVDRWQELAGLPRDKS